MANGQKPIVTVPVVVEVVQVRIPPRIVAIEVTDLPIAVELRDRTCKK